MATPWIATSPLARKGGTLESFFRCMATSCIAKGLAARQSGTLEYVALLEKTKTQKSE
jgi:hypothetical protein